MQCGGPPVYTDTGWWRVQELNQDWRNLMDLATTIFPIKNLPQSIENPRTWSKFTWWNSTEFINSINIPKIHPKFHPIPKFIQKNPSKIPQVYNSPGVSLDLPTFFAFRLRLSALTEDPELWSKVRAELLPDEKFHRVLGKICQALSWRPGGGRDVAGWL